MQEQHIYEYAVLRVVPKVEREEFLNVGVVVYCRTKKYLRCSYELNDTRISSFAPQLDLEELRGYLSAFAAICDGKAEGGPIAKLPIPERFRWLTAMRSTILQTSRVHPGLTGDPDERLSSLFNKLVSGS